MLPSFILQALHFRFQGLNLLPELRDQITLDGLDRVYDLVGFFDLPHKSSI